MDIQATRAMSWIRARGPAVDPAGVKPHTIAPDGDGTRGEERRDARARGRAGAPPLQPTSSSAPVARDAVQAARESFARARWAPGARALARDSVEQMLASGHACVGLDPELGEAVKDVLGEVRLNVLQTCQRAGVDIRVLRDGELPFDRARPVDVAARFADLSALARRVADSLARLEEDGLPAGCASLSEAREFAGALHADPEERVVRLAHKLTSSLRLRAAAAFAESGESRDGDESPVLFHGTYALPGRQAVDDHGLWQEPLLAWQHGARTPGEIAEFTALVRGLNRPLLLELRKECLQRDPEVSRAWREGQQAGARKLPPFRLDGAVLAVPNLFYFRRTDDASEEPLRLGWHDASVLQGLRDDQLAGVFWPGTEAAGTVVLREGHLGRSVHGSSTAVHELGHAYEAAVARLDPAYYASFKAKRDLTLRLMQESALVAPSAYAVTNAKELVAESFGHRHAKMRHLHAQWQRADVACSAVQSHLQGRRGGASLPVVSVGAGEGHETWYVAMGAFIDRADQLWSSDPSRLNRWRSLARSVVQGG